MSDKLREAALLALDALDSDDPTIQTRAALSLRAALAEPEQEPELMGYEHHEYRPYGAPGEIRIHAVLKSQYLHPNGSIGDDFQYLIDSYKTEKTTIKLIPLYTAPPRREWVGLTGDEVNLIYAEPQTHVGQYAKAIEAKLKEKNGG